MYTHIHARAHTYIYIYIHTLHTYIYMMKIYIYIYIQLPLARTWCWRLSWGGGSASPWTAAEMEAKRRHLLVLGTVLKPCRVLSLTARSLFLACDLRIWRPTTGARAQHRPHSLRPWRCMDRASRMSCPASSSFSCRPRCLVAEGPCYVFVGLPSWDPRFWESEVKVWTEPQIKIATMPGFLYIVRICTSAATLPAEPQAATAAHGSFPSPTGQTNGP